MTMTGITALLALPLAGATALPAPTANGVTEIRYEVTFDRTTAANRSIHVDMSFTVDDDEVVGLSIPAWTPGSYQLDDFAMHVRAVEAFEGERPIHWDKADFDTWRVYPTGAGRVRFSFDYHADQLDVGSAWAQSDLAFFNGTNLFPYPEGTDWLFPSEVSFSTEPGWRVATGMTSVGPLAYEAETYHELVDMPTFVGDFDLDSTTIGDKTYRLASYPSGAFAGEPRRLLWQQIRSMMPPMIDVVDAEPWADYTTLLVFDEAFGGGSALEHSNSHLGVYHPQFIGSPILASITAHEIFHAWNVKRIRPADLWPYDYGRPMPTELLWISEGITDYYADLALVRGDIVGDDFFYQITQGKIDEVASVPAVALEDASLSTWIQPTDGTGTIYYPKGSLAGFALDILIRDATDNARSLDDVMKRMYEEAYLRDRGFTEEEWWGAVEEISGGASFDAFHDAYIDGRTPFAWDEILPLAGMRLRRDVTTVPRLGTSTTTTANGVIVASVVPGSAAADAGVMTDDRILRVGTVEVESNDFGAEFRAAYDGRPAGTALDIVVERGGQELTLRAELRFLDVETSTLGPDPAAGDKARRIRSGILGGRSP